MTLKSNAKFRVELTFFLKKTDIRSLKNFDLSTQSLKNSILIDFSCAKYILFELKKYRGVILHDTKE